jgi:hypothetical protein
MIKVDKERSETAIQVEDTEAHKQLAPNVFIQQVSKALHAETLAKIEPYLNDACQKFMPLYISFQKSSDTISCDMLNSKAIISLDGEQLRFNSPLISTCIR